jgi:hypothetical protein
VWTFRQLQSSEVAVEQKKEFDLNHKVLWTLEEKVRSALIHVEQETSFLSQDCTLHGQFDPLVQAHLTQMAMMASSLNWQQLSDGRRAGRSGNCCSGGAGKTNRLRPRGPKTPPAAK